MIQIIDNAEEQMRGLLLYIAEDSRSNQVAQNYLEKTETAIKGLEMREYRECITSRQFVGRL
ncbi:hypothetical protein M2454_002833 [Aequitasia blattaphilus]|uniref:Uncharacterized protein n=1 Tax=Aequitasia blattaphilus TaxID=2949332 RepID=A0ABT1ECC7_9FIRM|nr:hypothetical protein [Aequitasia blattaphilus]MCP1103498.1 hypothetical protein [Aequitasia blattaphilus]MCR8616138.1 hypothetical protein [Aequitasia blattaphilus]